MSTKDIKDAKKKLKKFVDEAPYPQVPVSSSSNTYHDANGIERYRDSFRRVVRNGDPVVPAESDESMWSEETDEAAKPQEESASLPFTVPNLTAEDFLNAKTPLNFTPEDFKAAAKTYFSHRKAPGPRDVAQPVAGAHISAA